ncbi:HAD family hydrolase, partial [Mycoplasmopsis bovis]|uniref:HAD family hydrolase n=1 Tax=Mycoplasmopsis bovis TaxID=28903 RepID=UPI003D280A82
MELTAPGVNKGTGALWLCNHLDANPDFCMSIGDSNNELWMSVTILSLFSGRGYISILKMSLNIFASSYNQFGYSKKS